MSAKKRAGNQMGGANADFRRPKDEQKPAAAEAGAKKSNKLLFVLIPVVLLLVGGGAAWYLGKLPFGSKAEDAHAEGGEHGEAASAAEHGGGAAEKGGGGHGEGGGAGAGALLAIEPFLANLADDGGSRYLKATFQVEFAGAAPPAGIEARMPQIRTVRSRGESQTGVFRQGETTSIAHWALIRPARRSPFTTEFVCVWSRCPLIVSVPY